MIKALKSIQFMTSVTVTALFWLIYPGVMVLLASIVGLFYMMAAIGAIFENHIAIWFAFAISLLTAILSSLGVVRFAQGSFDFLAGNWGKSEEFALHPYLFVIVSLMSTVVVIMHLISWQWMIKGSKGLRD